MKYMKIVRKYPYWPRDSLYTPQKTNRILNHKLTGRSVHLWAEPTVWSRVGFIHLFIILTKPVVQPSGAQLPDI